MNPVHPRRKLRADTITLAHGSGGKAMRDLIDDVFVGGFDNAQLNELEDQARFDLDPLFFPGGDIGKLAVTGTVNDLAVGGARPLYLSCGMIIEEGLPVEDLRRIVASMKATADAAGVGIVTGDTKVVHRGAADKLFINTTGIGVLINGCIGDHGAAIVDARGEMSLDNSIETDCQPLNSLVEAMLAVCSDIRCMRDATRGGIATVLNEFAEASGVSIHLDEAALPVRDEVRGMCEILGLDPLYLANEGKLLAIVPPEQADACLQAMRAHPAGRDSAVIGQVYADDAGRVVLKTGFGGNRIVDMLVGEQLPRIC